MSPLLAAMLLGGIASWFLRASFLVFLSPERVPQRARRMLDYALPTFLAAILVESVAAEVTTDPRLLAAQLAALGAAVGVAWWTRGLASTLVAGVAVFILVDMATNAI